MSYTIADYTFTSTAATLPVFNDDYIYDYTDTVDETAGTTRRVIVAEEYPSSISFNGCGELLKVDELAITDKVTSMNSCFNECRKLSYINTINWNTSNVTNMDSLFRNCTSLTELDVSSFNTSNVTNMNSIFNGNISLTKIDLSNWNTSNATTFEKMFIGARKLTEVKGLENWNTSKVTNMDSVFYNCNNLTSLNLSNWDTSKVETMYYMFRYCNSLTSLDISNWDTSNIINMSLMFYNCNHLENVEMIYSDGSTVNKVISTLPANNTEAVNVWVEDVRASECTIPEGAKIVVKDYIVEEYSYYVFDTSLVADNLTLVLQNDRRGDNTEWDSITDWGDGTQDTKLSHTYSTNGIYTVKTKWCIQKSDSDTTSDENTKKSLIEVKNINKKCTNMFRIFRTCTNLNKVKIYDTANIINMCASFEGCNILSSLDVSNWDTSNVINMNALFSDCQKLTSLDVSNWNTSNVINMFWMFRNCYLLTSLDVSNFNTSKVANMNYMFYNCSSLTTLDISNFDTSNVTDMSYMFNGCNKLTTLNLSKWDTGKVTDMSAMFYNCTSLTSLDVSNFDTSKVNRMGSMFGNCILLTALDVSNFDTSNVNSMYAMFYNCASLTALDVSKWDTSKAINMSGMFNSCNKLTTLDISNFNMVNVTNQENMFYFCSNLKDIGMLYSDGSTVNKVISTLPTNNTEDINVWVQDVKTSECAIPKGANIAVKDYIVEEKEISINEPLRSLPNGVCDRIVHKNNKWYIERNVFNCNISDTSYIMKSGYELDNTVVFECRDFINDISTQNQEIIICDKFKTQTNWTNFKTIDEECCYLAGGTKYIYIRLAKTKLNELTVNDFKAWLTDNVLSCIVIGNIQYEEITDPVLTTYLDNTYISINTTIPSNINVKNHGINLQAVSPSTTYTVKSDLDGIQTSTTITTSGTLTDSDTYLVLDSDANKGKVFNNTMVLDGNIDYSVDYLEGMQSVGNDNIEIKSHNKNLFDFNKFVIDNTYGEISNGAITVKNPREGYFDTAGRFEIEVPNYLLGKYVMFYSDKIQGDGDVEIRQFDENHKQIAVVVTSKYTFQVLSTCKYINLNFSSRTKGTTTTWKNIQLEEGNVATSYVPYKEDTINLQLSEPLRRLPNGVCDKIVYKNNKWYVERNCGIRIFDDRDDWAYKSSNAFMTKFNECKENPIISDNLGYDISIGLIAKHKCCGWAPYSSYSVFWICNKDYDNLNDFKQWLKDNPTTIVYQLITPIYEEIINPQLLTYLDKTYITTNSFIPAKLNVSNSGIELRNIEPNQKYVLNKTGNNPVKVDLCGNEQNYSDILTTTDMVNNQMKLYGKSTTLTDMTLLRYDEQKDYTSYIKDKQHLDGETIKLDTITGHTLVNRAIDGEEIVLNDKIDISGTNEVVINDTVDNAKVDVVVEGNTLVNILKTNTSAWGKNLYNNNNNLYNNVFKRYNSDSMNSNMIIPNTTYTLIINFMPKYATGKMIILTDIAGSYSGEFVNNKFVFTTSNFDNSTSISSFVLHLDYDKTVEDNKELPSNDNMFMLLEGDYTDKIIPNDYFEGMKSVGELEDNKIEVLSTNKNLFDGKSVIEGFEIDEQGIISYNKGSDPRSWNYDNSQYFIDLKKGTYTISFIRITPVTGTSASNAGCRIYSKLDTFTSKAIGNDFFVGNRSEIWTETFTIDEKDTLGIMMKSYNGLFKIQLEKNSNSSSYEPHKLNKKEILLQEPLRGLSNGIKDRIVHKNNKWYVERNCGKIKYDDIIKIFSDIEPIEIIDNTARLTIRLEHVPYNIATCIMSNNFATYEVVPNLTDNTNIGIGITSSNLSVRLQGTTTKEMLNTIPDNTVIIHGKTTPTYEEITNPQLLTYLDKTYISINSTIPATLNVSNSGIELQGIAPNSTYTLAKDVVGTSTNAPAVDLAGKEQILQDTITTGDTINNYMKLYGKGLTYKNIMLLDGTENNYTEYFTGMRSSYDEINENGKYPVEVKVHGKNLFKLYLKTDWEYNAFLNLFTQNNIDTRKTLMWKIQGINKTYIKTMVLIVCNDIGKCSFNFKITDTFEYLRFGLNGSSKDTLLYFYPLSPGEYTMSFNILDNTQGNIIISNIQIEKNTQSTPYEHYWEDTKTIYLNSPLLQGDELVSKEDGVYHVHNTKTKLITGDENWYDMDQYAGAKNNTTYKRIGIPDIGVDSYLIATNYATGTTWGSDVECVSSSDVTFNLRISKSKIGGDTDECCKNYLKNNNFTICYTTKTSYEEKVLDEPLNFVPNNNNGTIDKVFLEHNTAIPVANTTTKPYIEELTYLQDNTKYVVTFNADKVGDISIDLGGTKTNYTTVSGYNKVEITTPSNTTNILKVDGKMINISKVVVSTQEPNEYFEGMKSVNTLEVKTRSKNLLSGEEFADTIVKVANGVKNTENKTIKFAASFIHNKIAFDKFKPNTQYFIRLKGYNTANADRPLSNVGVRYTDGSYTYLGFDMKTNICDFVSPSSKSIKELSGFWWDGWTYLYYNECGIFETSNDQQVEFEPYKEDTKQITLNEPLRSLPNGVCDRVIRRDDGWYIERNCKEMIINENTEVSKHTDYRYRVVISKQNDKYSIKFRSIYLSDKFKVDLEKMSNENYTLSYCNSGDECGHGGKYIVYLRLDDNDDNWNVTYLKSWLKDNPITVIYQLAEPIYEKIDDLVLDCYKDITYINNDSVIPITKLITSKVEPYKLSVKYLNPNTEYTIGFNSDIATEVTINLGGSITTSHVSKGENAIKVTTNDNPTNDLILSGVVNIEKLYVAVGGANDYFTDLNNLEISSINVYDKDNNLRQELPLNVTLCKVNDKADEIIEKEDGWYLERRCGIVNVSPNLIDYMSYMQNGIDTYAVIKTNGKIFTKDTTRMDNQFSLLQIGNPTNSVDKIWLSRVNGNETIKLSIQGLKTKTDYVNYLRTNPLKIVYELENPTSEKIDDLIFTTHEGGYIEINSLVKADTHVMSYNEYRLNNLKPSTEYSAIYDKDGIQNIDIITTPDVIENNKIEFTEEGTNISKLMFIEGDWRNKVIPKYFEGKTGCFNELNENGKYEVNILLMDGDNELNRVVLELDKPLFADEKIISTEDGVYVSRDNELTKISYVPITFTGKENCVIKCLSEISVDSISTRGYEVNTRTLKPNTTYAIRFKAYENGGTCIFTLGGNSVEYTVKAGINIVTIDVTTVKDNIFTIDGKHTNIANLTIGKK